MMLQEELETKLRELSVVKDATITLDTEIYYDLRISGDDMAALAAWIAERGGEACSGPAVAPGEPGDLFGAVERWLRIRRYPSFTVRDCLKMLQVQ